jgi:hypothetical protein
MCFNFFRLWLIEYRFRFTMRTTCAIVQFDNALQQPQPKTIESNKGTKA